MPAPAAFWRRTPPAVFAPIFGLIGLGLAWRAGLVLVGLPVALAELFLGAVTLLWLGAALSYAAKIAARPAVVTEDLRILPGRAGLAAGSLTLLALATVALPYGRGLATGLMAAGFATHLLLAALVLRVLLTGPEEQRRITPAWHLSFVGFIVGAVAAAGLGMEGLALTILGVTMIIAAWIYVESQRQLMTSDPPAPLRPLLAIHLAPPSLFGAVALLLDQPLLAQVFGLLGAGILAALVLKARYVAEAGFSPLWGAFTFPLSAYAGLCLSLGTVTGGLLWSLAGIALLVAASALVPWIAMRVLQMWIRGALAVKTNAAIA